MLTEKHKFFTNPEGPFDYKTLMQYVDELSERCNLCSITFPAVSLLDRRIPMISFGEGEKHILYIGTHHAMEWVTGIVLLAFAFELCDCAKYNRQHYGLDLSYILKTRTLHIIPMLNPDGVELQQHGIDESNPMKERLIKMNGGSADFSHWQANARGVDLNHNYNSGFSEYKKLEAQACIVGGGPTRYSGESSESEPEVGSLCNFIRFSDVKMILTLHSQGEEIYYSSGEKVPPGAEKIARLFAASSGYSLSKPEGLASYGGLTDWFIEEFNRPSFTIECGKGENPLPSSDWFSIYSKLRKTLFTAPTFIIS